MGFDEMFTMFEDIKKGFETLGDVRGDVKSAVSELERFNSNSERLIPLLEEITPQIKKGLNLLEKMDGNMDQIAKFVGFKSKKGP